MRLGKVVRFGAALSVVLGVMVLLPARGDAEPGTPEIHTVGLLRRGGWVDVVGSSLPPETVFALSADLGRFGKSGSGSTVITSVTSSADGRFDVLFTVGTDLAPTTTAVQVNASTEDTVLSTTIDVAGPLLNPVSGDDVCAAQPMQAIGAGFPDGSYVLTSPSVTFPVQPVAAAHGALAVSGSYAHDLAARVTTTATSVEEPQVAYTFVWNRSSTATAGSPSSETPWTTRYQGSCFTPGEKVTFASTDPHTIAPSAVTATAQGNISFTVQSIATATPSRPGGVRGVGTQSGQVILTGSRYVYPTTLTAGQSMPKSVLLLMSPHPSAGYTAGQNYCDLRIYKTWANGTGGSSPMWYALPKRSATDTCRLTLGMDGDLKLTTATGATLWSTQTQGTGSHNRLVMLDSGILALYGSAGLVWTSSTGIVRTPRAMGEGQTLTAGHSLSNGATRLTMRHTGNLVVTRYGKTRWSSHTAARRATRLVLRPNGNLVLYNRHGLRVWSTHTRDGGTNALLSVQPNGDVRLHNDYGDLYWHTHTGS